MKIVLTTLLMCMISTFANASEISDEKASALDNMLEIMGMEKQMLGGFEAMLPMVDQMAAQLQLNPEEKEELKSIYRNWFLKDIDRDAIVSKIRNLYAATFTTEEIVLLNEFYTSPLGQKFLEKSPELMKEGAQAGMMEAQKAQGKLLERIQPFLEKHSPTAPAPQE